MKEAIQYFGQKYHNNPNIYFLGGDALPEIVKAVVYDMFLNDLNTVNADKEDYVNMKKISRYCKELHKNGFATK